MKPLLIYYRSLILLIFTTNFQELQRQDAAKSLPNINAVFPNLTSPVSTSSQLIQSTGQQQQQQQIMLRSPSNNNIQSPLLLQPQNLHHLSRNQMQTAVLANKTSMNLDGPGYALTLLLVGDVKYISLAQQ